MIAEVICAVAAGYQLFAIAACISFRGQRPGARGEGPGLRGESEAVSILKPVNGIEPSMRSAIESHVKLIGDFEFLCGVRESDPAVKLLEQFPRAKMVPVSTKTPNLKAGALIDIARAAHNPILIVNDADIRVQPDYIPRVTAPLADPTTGLVTCLYRAEGSTFASRMEGLGIATDFAPSTLVARLVGVDEFAMGSTMAFRRDTLNRIGGFEAVSDYLADDYQIGHRIHALGLKCVLSDVIVTTHMTGGWRDVWLHQVRWSRTIRVSNFWGYLGLPVTFATVWALLLLGMREYSLAVAVLATRMLMATIAGCWVIGAKDTLKLWLLIPFRDLFGAAVWLTALFGRTVVWRGQRLKLDPKGRIVN